MQTEGHSPGDAAHQPDTATTQERAKMGTAADVDAAHELGMAPKPAHIGCAVCKAVHRQGQHVAVCECCAAIDTAAATRGTSSQDMATAVASRETLPALGAPCACPTRCDPKGSDTAHGSHWYDCAVSYKLALKQEAKLRKWALYDAATQGADVGVFGGGFQQGVSKEDALELCLRAVMALKTLQNRIPFEQSDPGVAWLDDARAIYADLVRWINVAFADHPPEERCACLERLCRYDSPFSASTHSDPSVIEACFSNVDDDIKARLRVLLRDGAETGIPRPSSSVRSSPTCMAERNGEAVSAALRMYVSKGFCHCIPASALDEIEEWKYRASPMHFVETDGRLAAHLSSSGVLPPGNDPNSLSPDREYGNPICDFVDEYVSVMLDMAKTAGLSKKQLVALKADIRRAHLQVRLHPGSVGSICIMWQGDLYMFRRTPFGWKWSSHTWTPFAAAIKQELERGENVPAAEGLEEIDTSDEARLSRLLFCVAYCDDFLALRFMCKHNTSDARLKLRRLGCLLIGPDAWNVKKGLEEGFWATSQRYTGIVFDFAGVLAYVDEEKWTKLRDGLRLILKLGFRAKTVQEVFGIGVWVTRIHRCLRSLLAPFRRCMQDADSAAHPDCIWSPARHMESDEQATAKALKDTVIFEQICSFAIEQPDRVKVPLHTLLPDHHWVDDTASSVVIHFGGDASMCGISLFNFNLREMSVLIVSTLLRAAIRRALDKKEDDPMRMVTIAILELLVLPACLLQWQSSLLTCEEVMFHTDNWLCASWVESGFASSPCAQAIMRVVAGFEFSYTFRTRCDRVWSQQNDLPDSSSRFFDEEGNKVQEQVTRFHRVNNALDEPYRETACNSAVAALLEWLHRFIHAFEDMPLPPPLHLLLDDSDSGTPLVAVWDAAAEGQPTPLQSKHGALPAEPDQHRPARLPATYMRDFRLGLTFAQAADSCRSWTQRFTFACCGCGVGLGAIGAIRAGFGPLWATEIRPSFTAAWSRLTDTLALGNMLHVDPRRLPTPHVLFSTMPCTRWCKHGSASDKTGDLWLLQADFALAIGADILVLEMVFNICKINGGAAVTAISRRLSPMYALFQRRIECWRMGDATSRVRLFLVGLKRRVFKRPPRSLPWQDRVFSDLCAPSLADIADADVAESAWQLRNTVLDEPTRPAPGKVHHIASGGAGVGPPSCPFDVYSYRGLPYCLSTLGGHGCIADADWAHPEPVLRTRGLSVHEQERICNIDPSFREGLLPDASDDAWCEAMALGVPVHTARGVFGMCDTLLRGVGAQPADRAASQDPAMLVTNVTWRPTAAGRQSHGSRRPTSADVTAIESALPPRNWSVPILHAGPGRPRQQAQRSSHGVHGRISHAEWVQMEHMRSCLRAVELEPGTLRRYTAAQRECLEFLRAYPLPSPRHGDAGVVFDPLVWQPSEVEAFLYDWVLHESGCRGNSHSTVRGKLYGVRHLNVREGVGDILKNKRRLDQLLAALKKFSGPASKKAPVTRAMLLVIRASLDMGSDDGIIIWASVITAFHFFCRSAEYCAKLSGGRFALDKVLLMGGVSFLQDGQRCRPHLATALRVRFAKTKAGGYEHRTQLAIDSPLCVVSAMQALFVVKAGAPDTAPLFAWTSGSRRAGDGVRYYDVVKLLKSAAQTLGDDPRSYASHSLRRGAMTAYMCAGCPYHVARQFARWRSDVALEYWDVLDEALAAFIGPVSRGYRDPRIVPSAPVPARPELLRQGWAAATLRASGAST